MRSGAGPSAPVWSAREREVLDLITRGRTNSEIAGALGISFATAKWHVSELISKLGVQSREDVADYWRQQRSLGGRVRRLTHGIAGFTVLKLAGAGALGLAAVAGGGALWGQRSYQRPSVAVVAGVATVTPIPMPTPVPTPLPGRAIFASAVQGTDGCIPTDERGRPLCNYRRYPEIVKLDKGNCDFSGVIFPQGQAGLLNYIDLHGCNLSGAVLRGVAANEADFSGANLSGADLTAALFSQSDFSRANLTNARADPGVFQAVNFQGANLTGANFARAIMTPINWRNTTCPDGSNSDTQGGTCIGTPGLENPPTTFDTRGQPPGICPGDYRDQPLGFLCAPALLPALEGKDLGGCNYAGADLAGLALQNADFRGCALSGANLAGARLEHASFKGANLAGANFSRTALRWTDFTGADVRGVDFSGAYADGLHLVEANLLRAKFQGAVLWGFWADTICPDGTNSDLDDNDGRTCMSNLAP